MVTEAEKLALEELPLQMVDDPDTVTLTGDAGVVVTVIELLVAEPAVMHGALDDMTTLITSPLFAARVNVALVPLLTVVPLTRHE